MNSELSRAKVGFHTDTRDMLFRAGSSDKDVLAQVFQRGDYEWRKLTCGPAITRALEGLASRNERPLVVDAGANIGAASVFFTIGLPTARIVAIEPEEANYQILCQNLRTLDAGVMKAAVASTSGWAKVTDPDRGFWAFRTERAEQAPTSVPFVTLNEIYEREVRDKVRPFIVKVDIEGFEGELFSANTEWVDETPILMVELHDWLFPGQKTSQSFLQCIADKGRDFYLLGENVVSVRHHLS